MNMMADIDLRLVEPDELPWVAVFGGIEIGRFATRGEAIAAVNVKDRVNLATVRHRDTKETWCRVKYGRFRYVRPNV